MKRPPITALTPDIPNEMLLTPADIGAIAGIREGFARDLLRRAIIPGATRFGRYLRIPAGKVREFIEAESLPKNRQIFDLRAR